MKLFQSSSNVKTQRRYNVTVCNIHKQSDRTHTLLSSLLMPLLPPTLPPFIALPVTLHDLLLPLLPRLFFVAWPRASSMKPLLHLFLCVAIVENGPSQELLFCNQTQSCFNLFSHKYNTSTTVQPLFSPCPKYLLPSFLSDKCMQYSAATICFSVSWSPQFLSLTALSLKVKEVQRAGGLQRGECADQLQTKLWDTGGEQTHWGMSLLSRNLQTPPNRVQQISQHLSIVRTQIQYRWAKAEEENYMNSSLERSEAASINCVWTADWIQMADVCRQTVGSAVCLQT